MADGASNVLDRFRAGDLGAFEALFREHQRPVYAWILRLVRNQAAAEDLTVETFWRIHRSRERFEPHLAFAPWARRIATRVALDWLRARRPEVELTAEIAGTFPSASARDPGIAAEIREKTALAFARLPPNLRAAATLRTHSEFCSWDLAALRGSMHAMCLIRLSLVHSSQALSPTTWSGSTSSAS